MSLDLNTRARAAAPTVVRVGVSLVFLWFGSQQLMDANAWAGLIPNWVLTLVPLSAQSLVRFNGSFEVVFGCALLVGIFTRITALLLALHLFHIMTVVGYNDIGVRDFGLSMATLSVFLYGSDPLCLENWLKRSANDPRGNTTAGIA